MSLPAFSGSSSPFSKALSSFAGMRRPEASPASLGLTAAALALTAAAVPLRRWWSAPLRLERLAPPLVGERSSFDSPSGPLAARVRPGRPGSRVVVLVHGWAGCADLSWWRTFPRLEELDPDGDVTFVALDLPGHGRSDLDEEFSLSLAADRVAGVLPDICKNFGVDEVSLVGVSMGGTVSMMVTRRTPDLVSDLVLVATSAFWNGLSSRWKLALAPYVLAPSSPVTSVLHRNQLISEPDLAPFHLWGYGLLPARRVLADSLRDLRRFDSRDWVGDLDTDVTWVVTSEDRIISAAYQTESAERAAARILQLDSPHSVMFLDPESASSALGSALGLPGADSVQDSALPASGEPGSPGAILDAAGLGTATDSVTDPVGPTLPSAVSS